jgi:hypothetical protein
MSANNHLKSPGSLLQADGWSDSVAG